MQVASEAENHEAYPVERDAQFQHTALVVRFCAAKKDLFLIFELFLFLTIYSDSPYSPLCVSIRPT